MHYTFLLFFLWDLEFSFLALIAEQITFGPVFKPLGPNRATWMSPAAVKLMDETLICH